MKIKLRISLVICSLLCWAGTGAAGTDLNTATFDELLELPGINRYQAYKIIEYRRVFGYFLTLDELLKVEGVNPQDVLSWSSLISVMPPAADKVPAGMIKVKAKKTSDVADGNYQAWHVRLKDFQPGWSSAFVFEQYPHYDSYRVEGSKATRGIWNQRLILNKYYLSWKPGSAVKEIIAGDYLIGFGEGVVIDLSGRAKPVGIYPGDTVAMEYNTAKISDHALLQGVSYKSSKTFRGLAITLEQDNFRESFFYSNESNGYYGFYINGSEIRNPLEDYFREQVGGGDITAYLAPETEVGVSGYYSQRAVKGPDPWRYPAGDTEFMVYGAHFSSYLGRLNVCGEIGQVQKYGQGLLAASTLDLGRVSYAFSYRQYDLDYYNPHAGSYSLHYPQSVFRCRDERGFLGKVEWHLMDQVKIKTSFDQYTHQAQVYWSKKAGNYVVYDNRRETDREISIAGIVQSSPKMGFSVESRYKDNNINKDSGSEKISTSASLKYAFSDRGDASVKYYLRTYVHNSADYTPYDYVSINGDYQLSKPCRIEGGGKYRNIIRYRKFEGIREYKGKIKYKIRSGLSVQLGYVTTYVLGNSASYEFEDEADLIADEDAYFQDTWTLEVVFNW
ncbi:MAG: helix-hairpin-helix domain-containing protein [bacterium]|nr:helix-hairpin-helix domain-containing protein [bacterium]